MELYVPYLQLVFFGPACNIKGFTLSDLSGQKEDDGCCSGDIETDGNKIPWDLGRRILIFNITWERSNFVPPLGWGKPQIFMDYILPLCLVRWGGVITTNDLLWNLQLESPKWWIFCQKLTWKSTIQSNKNQESSRLIYCIGFATINSKIDIIYPIPVGDVEKNKTSWDVETKIYTLILVISI